MTDKTRTVRRRRQKQASTKSELENTNLRSPEGEEDHRKTVRPATRSARRDTVPGCRVGDATSAGWLKTGAAKAASVGVWTRSGLVVDRRADGSRVANTAATVVLRGTLWHTINSESTGTNQAQCFANAWASRSRTKARASKRQRRRRIQRLGGWGKPAHFARLLRYSSPFCRGVLAQDIPT